MSFNFILENSKINKYGQMIMDQNSRRKYTQESEKSYKAAATARGSVCVNGGRAKFIAEEPREEALGILNVQNFDVYNENFSDTDEIVEHDS
jgi:hypothetical protein